eukprot:CAMPEP_0118657286 /NCGR_PEP_ID=MMETSP0785-20121206/13939_1 /TAXON_ID=91992 /ORGANISM="Bolidomonas pacifica, Strain CCMP 1866" /LENGTH=102 /DNA_ID=CAMNT_0006550197 /DNA_START=114 /DNA_END=418 /DNA_ORIENTATION=+
MASASSTAFVMLITPQYPSNASVGDVLSAAGDASKITYSSTARNLNRLSSGDSSAGSKYITSSPSSRKRRAAQGCKYDAILKEVGVTKIACNKNVLEGEVEG